MKITDDQFHRPISLPDKRNFFVLVRGNNSGKSTILRAINKSGSDSYLIDVNRTTLEGEGAPDDNYEKDYGAYVNQFRNYEDDNRKKPMKVLQDYFNLNDKDREPIIDWYNKFFPNKIYEERKNLQNKASPMLLKINGFSMTKQGSGIRCTLEIFVKLFDPKIKVLCIDEPEMGLESGLQKFLYQAIKAKSSKNKKIIISTHSHNFLDYKTITNNHISYRDMDNKIRINRVNNQDTFQHTIFQLLGNSLSDLLLPEKILILEGPSDNKFVTKILELLGKKGFKIHPAGGSGNTTDAIKAITQFTKFNNQTIFKDKIWVLIDKQKDTPATRLWKQQLGQDKVKILSKNGIEYFYPHRIIKKIFNSNENLETIIKKFLKEEKSSSSRLSKTELSRQVSAELKKLDIKDRDNELFNFLKILP